MYIEKRKAGKGIKFYLIYSFRENGSVQKIRKYLGRNLNKEQLNTARDKAKKQIDELILRLSTEVFQFSLTDAQIKKLNKINKKVDIFHLSAKEWERFTEQFTYNTNAIEGSTLLLDDVQNALKMKNPSGFEEIEAKGVASAVAYLRKTKDEFSLKMILRLHYLCFHGSKDFAGRLRDVEVVIRSAKGEILHQGVPSSNVGYALKELICWHKKNSKKFKPIVLAAIVHNQFEFIHPFQDGNGRVGRLLLNHILLEKGYPPINISLSDRMEYYQTLQEYQNNGNLKPTLDFLVKQYKKTLKQVTTKSKLT